MRALVLGGIAWNTMVYLDAFPQPSPRTVFARHSHEAVGSSGAGKAMNLRHLGADVTLWGLLGDDPAGARARAELESRGIHLITQLDPAGTMRHINLMNPGGQRISIFVNSGSHDVVVDTRVVAAAAASADVVAVTILDYCRQFLPLLRELGAPLWVDIHDYDGHNPYHREFIDAAHYLFVSSIALEDWRTFLESQVAAGTQVAVCTHGEGGASGLTAEAGWIDVPAVPVDVVDSNGAGDAFFAGFSTSWTTEASLGAALQRGALAAAAAVQSPELAPIATD